MHYIHFHLVSNHEKIWLNRVLNEEDYKIWPIEALRLGTSNLACIGISFQWIILVYLSNPPVIYNKSVKSIFISESLLLYINIWDNKMAHKEDFTTKNRLTNPAFLFYNDFVTCNGSLLLTRYWFGYLAKVQPAEHQYIRKCGCVFASQYKNIDKNTPIKYKLT